MLWPRPRDCAAEASLDGVWDTDVQAQAAARAADAQTSYVASAWPATSAALDDFAQRWAEQRVRACELADVRAEPLGARSLDCLEARRDDLAFVTAGLVAGDEDMLTTAVNLVTGLPAPVACNDEAVLSSWVIPDPGPRSELRERTRVDLRTAALRLASARSGGAGMSYENTMQAAMSAADSARVGAVDLSDAGLEARALYLLGQIAQFEGDPKRAEEFLALSAARAEKSGDDRARVRALSFLVYAIGRDADRFGEVEQIAAQAQSVLATLGDPPLLRAQLVGNLGAAMARARPPDPRGAIANLREALDLLTATVGENHPDVLSARVNLGNTLGRVGEIEASRAELAATAKAAPGVWGKDHPLTARVEGMLGMALLRSGDKEDARRHLEVALAKSRAALGDEHQQVSDAHYNLAIALRRLGKHADAADHLRRGLEIRQRVHKVRAGGLIAWHFALGREELALGRFDEAATTLRTALDMCEADGAVPSDYARVRFALARALVRSQPARAKFLAEQAEEFYAADEHGQGKLKAVRRFLADQKTMSSSDRGATSNPL